MTADVVERYLELSPAMDRPVDGSAASCYRPKALARHVGAAPVTPVAEARALLAAVDAETAADRSRRRS
jgi:hypothetical protein